MGIDDRLVRVEKDDPIHRRLDSLDNGSRIGIHDFRQRVSLLDAGIHIGMTDEETSGIGLDIHKGVSFNKLGNTPSVASVLDDAVFVQKPQYGIDGLLGTDYINAVGSAGILRCSALFCFGGNNSLEGGYNGGI